MQLSNSPAKLPIAFAASGSKNTIPVASQVGITPGAASLTDGFPPLTRTAISAGGVPPSGLDMNGVLYEISAVARWANVGGGYVYDGTFASDSNVGGYPKGARILRTDGTGYWINTVDNNTTDPESVGAAAAGWVPDFTSGAASITMTGSNVTLTPVQYGKPIIVITGTLTADLNLIFPAIPGQWIVVNQTSGAHTITAKTASGSGSTVSGTTYVAGDGVNISSSAQSVPDASTSVKGKIQIAASSDIKSGTSGVLAITPSALLSAIGFAAFFESAANSYTNAGLLTLAHGIGRAPKFVQMIFQNVTAEHGYSPGDQVFVYAGEGPAANRGTGVYVDSTNVYVRIASSGIEVVNKTTGGQGICTVANWAVVVRAWG